jgi:hypothetical protein
MKFGLRKPSLKGMFSARTSWKRAVRNELGLKAPRGWGWLTNPRKAAYNRVYNRTTFSIGSLFGGRRGGSGCVVVIAIAVLSIIALIVGLV